LFAAAIGALAQSKCSPKVNFLFPKMRSMIPQLYRWQMPHAFMFFVFAIGALTAIATVLKIENQMNFCQRIER
jgi:hypothetical protein